MHNTASTLHSSIIFGALSLASGTTFGYICLGLGCASLAIYVVHYHLPSEKFARLEDGIKVVEGSLKRAKEDCTRDHVDLLDIESDLLQASLSASEIRSQMLEVGRVFPLSEFNVVIDRGVVGRLAAYCGALKKYLQDVRGITKHIWKCEKEVEKIKTATLRIIEEERRRKLFGAMKEVREVIEVLRSPTRHAHAARNRGHSDVANFFQESYTISIFLYPVLLYLTDGQIQTNVWGL
ncbi:hypothetical protein C8R44DRAFT_735299 [Mycena epipterygia]|nr:hypothetical protein C8R44DRAFT_735299 [Mycena epipterygia]